MIATNKQHAHELLDRLPSDQMSTAVRFLEFLLLEDEEISEEEETAVALSKEWFQHNEGIPFEELVASNSLRQNTSTQTGDRHGR